MIISDNLSRRLLLCFSFGLIVVFDVGAQPALLKDINTGPSQATIGSFPFQLTACNDLLFFTAVNPEFGQELWKSNGTPDGTQIVRDIAPDGMGAGISDLMALDNTVYFAASDQIHGKELWKSDGTETGTVMIDIIPGSSGSNPMWMTNVNGTLYFVAQDPEHGKELWKSDGTVDGTTMVKDIVPGSGTGFNSFVSSFTAVNSILFFTVDDGTHGTELWRSDGTEDGTQLVKDIHSGSASSEFFRLTAIGDYLYFIGNDGVHGQELWVSNGVDAGTYMVKDINPGLGNCLITHITTLQGEVLFFVSQSDSFQLWKTDGTEGGTVLVTNKPPALVGGHYDPPGTLRDKIYFTAGDQQLWGTDGTDAGTEFIKQFDPASPTQFLGTDGSFMYLSVAELGSGQELWVSNGTPAGTVILKDINEHGSSSPGRMTIVDGKAFFTADDDISGLELWATDGSADGTGLVKDINTSLAYFPTNLHVVGSNVLFVNHKSHSTYEVWKTDGSANGTTLVKDINPGSIQFLGGTMEASDEKMFMVLDDGIHGFELWVSDGTESGTTLLKDFRPGPEDTHVRFFEERAMLNGNIFFEADDGINGTALWKTDGTESGTAMITPLSQIFGESFIESVLTAGDVVYFVTSFSLWKTDGTDAGTVRVKELNPTHSGFNPSNLYYLDGTLYFVATDGTHGLELWRSDGTESGTYMVKDIHTSETDHFMSIIGDVNGKLIFSAAASDLDYELWTSDGTASGTVLLKDINAVQGSSPARISQSEGLVFFSATDDEHGNELWKTDGTPNGTVLVKDISPGVAGSSPYYSSMYNGTLYFSAYDTERGTELWKTDGTLAGTRLVIDIAPGIFGSIPFDFTVLGNALLFTADDGVHGRELWKLETITQSLTFPPLEDKVANESPFEIEATASSGLPVSFNVISGPVEISENVVTILGAGHVTIRAEQPGNETVEAAAPVEMSFEITKASQTISFPTLTSKKSNDPPFELGASSSSGLPVTFTVVSGPATLTGSTLTLTGAGEVTIKASQSGNEIYNPAEDVLQSFSVQLILGLESPEDGIVRIYPNPTSGILYFEFIEPQNINAVTLVDSKGVKIQAEENRFDGRRGAIQTTGLPPGIYILQILQEDNTTISKKILVH